MFFPIHEGKQQVGSSSKWWSHDAETPPEAIGQEWEDKNQGQHGIVVPLIKAVTDVTRGHPQCRGNGGLPVGFLGQAVLRMEQCDMMSNSQNLESKKCHRGVHC
jgi:hypothetical protein